MGLIFNSTLADSIPQRTLTGPDGAYQVKLRSGLHYRVSLTKDGRQVGVKSYSVPGMPADSGRIVHNFYVDY